MPIRLVVTDMDNTLYSWVNYIVPAVEAMVEAVVHATGFQKLKVIQSLKAVYEKFPYVLALIMLVTFVLLVRTFRSVLLPPQMVIFEPAGSWEHGRIFLVLTAWIIVGLVACLYVFRWSDRT